MASTSTAHRSTDEAFEVALELRDDFEQAERVVAQGFVDLVGDAQLGEAQDSGLPQREDVQGEPAVDVVDVDRAVAGRRSGGQQAGHVAEHVEHGLAADLRRMGCDHRHDEQVVDQPLDRHGVDPTGGQVVHRRRQAAELRPRAVHPVVAAAAFVVDVLGGVRQGGQPAEGPDQVQLVVDRSPGELVVQRAERAPTVAPGADGALADSLDELEHVVAGLVPHDLAEQPAEEADVRADRRVLAGLGL